MGGKTLNRGFRNFGILGLLLAGSIGLACCGGSSSATGMGTANVTMSDPPSNTAYKAVWVTVEGVKATTSTSDTGWQSLVSDIGPSNGKINAVQVNLLDLPSNPNTTSNCLLALLGSTKSLPAGNYEQIRLILVPNNATNVNLESPSGESTTNQCTSVGAWNCAMPTGGTMTALDLSSEAQTGIKIPPGQVMGGPIDVAPGKSVDINIDFNADRSIVEEGSGQLRLDPVLLAYQDSGASMNQSGISGQVVLATSSGLSVSALSSDPGIGAANIALEMPNSSGVDLIGNYLETTDSSGNFDFCPLPTGPFDVVVSAGPKTVTSGSSTTTDAYGATIVQGVLNGTQLKVPLLAQTDGYAELKGSVDNESFVSTSTTTTPTDDIFALQQPMSGGSYFAVPLLNSISSPVVTSDPSMAQFSDFTCSSGTCTGSYQLYLPLSNPLFGTFSQSGVTWGTPAGSPFNYKVEATCTNSSNNLVDETSANQSLTASSTPPTTDSVPTLTLSGCQ